MSTQAPITVVVVEEEVLVRGMLVDYIERLGGYTVVLAVGHGPAFVAAAAKCPAPRVAVVATRGPAGGANGADTVAWMKEHWPGTRVLALLCERTASTLLRVLRAGACGYVCRLTTPAANLKVALGAVCTHGQYQPADLLPMLAAGDTVAMEHEAAIASLTRMERKVLDRVCTPDLPQWKEVAARLFLTLATIDSHRAQLFKKLGVHSKTALVHKGLAMDFGKGRW
ncbi:MAG: response regulator transcription factor [Flavobacteriales bacterium]